MDALSVLNKQIEPHKVLEHYDFDNIVGDGEFIRSNCKIHGGNNPTAFVISEETGLWFCHTGDCGGGDIYTLIQAMEGCTFKEAVSWIAEFFHIDISALHIKEREEKHMKEMKQWIKTVQNRRKKEIPPYSVDGEFLEIGDFRTFKEETIIHFGAFYAKVINLKKRNGEPYKLFNRIVFPIIYNSKQIGVSLRKTKAKDNPKWLHQPVNIETKNLLYNYDATQYKDTIVIVEGITDAWAFHEIGVTAVATFGAHVTDEQYKLLIRTGANLVFAFDGDEAGQNATEKAIKMFRNKANIGHVVFDASEDPESITREELKEKYESRRKR